MLSGLRKLIWKFNRSRRFEALSQIDFASGLGESAWALYGLARALRPTTCVEIGTARGMSTCFIATALRDNRHGTLHAIDPHSPTSWNDSKSIDTYPIVTANIARLKLQDYVVIHRQTSDEAAKKWSLPIDLIFIDGDHSYEGCKRDWDMFIPFVSKFGVVVFHDTTWEFHRDSPWYRADAGVSTFVDELRRDGYPVITWDRNCGVSLVQPSKNGIPLLV